MILELRQNGDPSGELHGSGNPKCPDVMEVYWALSTLSVMATIEGVAPTSIFRNMLEVEAPLSLKTFF